VERLGRQRAAHERDRDGGGEHERKPPRRPRERDASEDGQRVATPIVTVMLAGLPKRAGIAMSQ
jgi:hypothetical protein